MRVMELRAAGPQDAGFLIEMARHACTLEDRPLPARDDPAVLALAARPDDLVVVATDEEGLAVGAAWCKVRDVPLVRSVDGAPLPELAMAVDPSYRRLGVGTALIEALAVRAEAAGFAALTLNVHVRNPARHLYERACFVPAGQGRGPLGLAMRRPLGG